jgi:hypothetical protein
MAHPRPLRFRAFVKALARHMWSGLTLLGYAGWYTPPWQWAVAPAERRARVAAARTVAVPHAQADAPLTPAEHTAWLGLQSRLLATAEE